MGAGWGGGDTGKTSGMNEHYLSENSVDYANGLRLRLSADYSPAQPFMEHNGAEPDMITHHEALIYTMVLVSAADREMPDVELDSMTDMVAHLPVFRDFKTRRVGKIGAACAKLLEDENGLDKAFKLIRKGLPRKLRETAYALACDVAAADGKVSQEESDVLEMIRDQLDIGRLPAAAIERGARARYLSI